jgi:hypothetical protein
MFKKNPKNQIPTTVDEAAEVLIGDLLTYHLDNLTTLNEKELDKLHEAIRTYIADEFKLWSGNDQLLSSCLKEAGSENDNFDPSTIILKKIKSKLMDTYGIIIIT